MARVTRSKKIDIAEDQSALAIQTPLPETPAKNALAELPKESNIMPSVEEDEVNTELKGLKAAYRTAIGLGKKNKKGKGKKKNNQESLELSRDSTTDEIVASVDAEPPKNKKGKVTSDKEETPIGQSMVDVEASSSRNCSEGSLGSLPRRLSKLAMEDLTALAATVEEQKKSTGRATRATRQQLAKAQAGQSELSFKGQECFSTMRPSGDYILSLFAGTFRPTNYNSTVGRATTNNILFLADAAQNAAALDAHGSNESLVEVEMTGECDVPPQYTPEAPIESKSLIEEKRTRTISQSPTKSGAKTLEEVESAFATEGPAGVVDDDSFVEQIICRSPAKPVSRIEDSVEALDQLEEALEAIDEAASAERIVPTAQIAKENTKPDVSRKEQSTKPAKQPTNPKHPTLTDLIVHSAVHPLNPI